MPNDNWMQANVNSIWWTANLAVRRIEEINPDLVIVVLGSGIWAWQAVERLWNATHNTPLPPILLMHIHGADRPTLPNQIDNILKGSDEAPELWGQLIEWTVHQPGWSSRFQAAVMSALHGTPPQSMLFVDDVLSTGTTAAIAIGLAHDAFPAARAEYVAGFRKMWRDELAFHWLADYRVRRTAGTQTEISDPEQKRLNGVAARVWNCTRLYERLETTSLRLKPLDLQKCMTARGNVLAVHEIEAIRDSFTPLILRTIDDGIAHAMPTQATGLHGIDGPVAVRYDAVTSLWRALTRQGPMTLAAVMAATNWQADEAQRRVDKYIYHEMLQCEDGLYAIAPEYLLGHPMHDEE